MIERRYGTQRNKRLDSNLLNSPFQIDQRSFEDILGYISYLLKHVNFYNLDNEIDGQWDEVLKSDPILMMVQIINEPMTLLNQLIQNNEGRKTSDNTSKKLVIDTLIQWYSKIEYWHETLLNQGEAKLASKVKNVLVDVLALQRAELITYREQGLTEDNDGNNLPTTKSPLPPNAKSKGPIDLSKSLHTFQKIIIHIQGITKIYLEKNLYKKNNLTPNNAMYVAFTLLFKKAQEQLNTLSQRHLDFYYSDILQQSLNNGKPTTAIINFDLLPGLEFSQVDKGSQLSAGKILGSKTDILFQTEKPLMVQQMELLEMHTLLFQSNPYIKVGTNTPLVSSITQKALITKGKEASPKNSWYAFGANKRTQRDTQINPKTIAKIGFIIGSPVLLLKEGIREINLHFHMQSTPNKNGFWDLLNQIKTNRKITMETVFSDVFEDGFNISYSSTKGWITISKYSIDFNEVCNYFTISIVLNSSDAPLEKSNKVPQVLNWPSIRVGLNEFSPNYLYSFLKEVNLASISIDVNVKRMKDLALYNNIGKMPLNKAFDLFGPIPEKGSFLMIGEPELFQKQIQDLNIKIDWSNSPDDFGGFGTYYKGYSGNYSDDTFKVQLTALSNGYWVPNQKIDIPILDLFNTFNCQTPEGYPSSQISTTSSIDISNFDTLGIATDNTIPTPLIYDVKSQSGFIKLTLTEPSMGFGNDLYQNEYIEIATFNAKNKQQLPYPNKPFIPKVNSISISYTASDKLLFSDDLSKSASNESTGDFFQITPFGTIGVITDKNVSQNTLLPDFSAEGYLVLGFSGVKHNTFVSLYFQFLHSSTSKHINPEGLHWEYLQSNEWHPFEKGNIILDETNGFIKSGIIEIILPKLDNYKTKLKEETYWIRISISSNAMHYPIIEGVFINATKVTCLSTDPQIIGQIIPAGSIKKLLGKNPDIKQVNQPGDSLTGKTIETQSQYYTRVSERIRHKERAVSIWDYERLILENFDEVLIVKCTNRNKHFESVPRHLKVIVISARSSLKERHYFNEDALAQMKTFLQKKTNPFVQIEVINPSAEWLLVNCIIEFKPEDNGGYYINQLNEDISNFLSPISNSENDIGGIGDTLIPTMVVSFVDNLPYIQSIRKLSIEHIVSLENDVFSLGIYQGDEEIKASTPWSILTPVKNHRIISVLKGQTSSNDLDVGIGNIQIGNDFILGSDKDNVSNSKEKVVLDSPSDLEPLTDSIFVFKDKSQ